MLDFLAEAVQLSFGVSGNCIARRNIIELHYESLNPVSNVFGNMTKPANLLLRPNPMVGNLLKGCVQTFIQTAHVRTT